MAADRGEGGRERGRSQRPAPRGTGRPSGGTGRPTGGTGRPTGGAAASGSGSASRSGGAKGRPAGGGEAARSGRTERPGHAPRAGSRPGAPKPGREPREAARPARRPAADEPPLPEGVTAADLDPDVRRQLRSLPKGLADVVGGHLAAAAHLLADDPSTAHRHALIAVRLASRIAAAREAAGVTAYATEHWAQALAELRAARRLSGSDEYLPMMADCERGLGRPERALALAGSPEAARLDRAGRVEMRIVASGARRDMGQLDAALVTLQCPELRDADQPWSARLMYAYGDVLLAADRRADAREWFARASLADPEQATDAAERLDELDGVVFVDEPEHPESADGSAG